MILLGQFDHFLYQQNKKKNNNNVLVAMISPTFPAQFVGTHFSVDAQIFEFFLMLTITILSCWWG